MDKLPIGTRLMRTGPNKGVAHTGRVFYIKDYLLGVAVRLMPISKEPYDRGSDAWFIANIDGVGSYWKIIDCDEKFHG